MITPATDRTAIVRIRLCEKGFLYPLAAFAALIALSACSDRRPPTPPAAKAIARGIWETPPPGIDSVKGECTGKLALAPFLPHRHLQAQPYPVVYDCASKTFDVLNSHDNIVAVTDLTLMNDGYYMHQSQIT